MPIAAISTRHRLARHRLSDVSRRPGDPYRVLLTQGAFHVTGAQLANVSVVLPFICAAAGYVWAAGMLFPAFTVGNVIGNSLSPYLLLRAHRLKHLVIVGSTAVMSLLVAVAAWSAWTEFFIAATFLVVALAIGVTSGVSRVAYSEVVSSKLEGSRRGDLVLTQGALGAIGAIGTTLLLLPLLTHPDPVHTRLDVLWVGAAGLLIAAFAALFVGPVDDAVAAPSTFSQIYRAGIRTAVSESWFRSYAFVQLLFVPVSLGTSFYSIHATVNHSDTAGSLHVLVVSSSVGMVLGAFLWRFVSRYLGVRGMFVNSALLGTAAAAVSLATEYRNDLSHNWIAGCVFILATMATQATFTAGITWVTSYAAEPDRPTLLAFGSLIVAVASSVLGAVLVSVAQDAAVIGPITAILGLNIAAGIAASRLAPHSSPN